jgi:hypothetical protein
LHLAGGTGCNLRSNGVQLTQERGAAIAPKPSIEPSREPPAALASAPETGLPSDVQPGGGAVGEFFDALGRGWLLSADQRSRLARAVGTAVAAGWGAKELAEFVGGNSKGIRSPYAVLTARLSPDDLPAPRGGTTAPRRRPWCGHCDPDTRFLLDEHGYPGDSPRRCPECGTAPARKDSA